MGAIAPPKMPQKYILAKSCVTFIFLTRTLLGRLTAAIMGRGVGKGVRGTRGHVPPEIPMRKIF